MVSPYQRPIGGTDTKDLIGKDLDLNHQRGILFRSQHSKIQESPDKFVDLTPAYNNRLDSDGKKFIKVKKLEINQNAQINKNFHDFINSAKIVEKKENKDNEAITIKGLNLNKNHNSNQINEEISLHMKNQIINEKLQNTDQIASIIKVQTRNNLTGSQSKRNPQISPQQKQVLSMSKITKLSHFSNQKESGDDTNKIIKQRRKKSQGKISLNSQNINTNETPKTKSNYPLRSCSQPQIRSQSQQAVFQDKQQQHIIIKKQTIKQHESSQNYQLLFKQENQNYMTNDNPIRVERNVPSSGALPKNSSQKSIKKNLGLKILNGQQAVKISKDQIMLKQTNHNSQGNQKNAKPHQAIQRSRSLSNSKHVQKKCQQFNEKLIKQCDENQNCAIDQINQFTNRTLIKEKKSHLGNSLNQQMTHMKIQRSKSSNKSPPQATLDDCIQGPLINPLNSQQQNSSKVLMFKTKSEESNSKVAALKSIIKLSSNIATNNYIQSTKSISNSLQSKENYNNVNDQNNQKDQQKQVQNDSNAKENQQKQFKLINKFKVASAGESKGALTLSQQIYNNLPCYQQPNKDAIQNNQKILQQNQKVINKPQQQYMQRITSSRLANQQNLNYRTQLKSAKDISYRHQEIPMSSYYNYNQSNQEEPNSIDIKEQENKNNNDDEDLIDTSTDKKYQKNTIDLKNSNKKPYVQPQQKMQQILQNQQNRNINNPKFQNLANRTGLFKNQSQAQSICDEYSQYSSKKKCTTNAKQSFKLNNPIDQNETFKTNNNQIFQDLGSKRSSILLNFDSKSQFNKPQIFKQITKKNYVPNNDNENNILKVKDLVKQQKQNAIDNQQKFQNTTQIIYSTANQDTARKEQNLLTQEKSNNNLPFTKQFTLKSEQPYHQYNKSHLIEVFSDEKRFKKLDFQYDQISPTSEILRKFKNSELSSSFQNTNDNCLDDESIVIIQEDQLRIPQYRSSSNYNSNQPIKSIQQITIQEEQNPLELIQQENDESQQSSIFFKKHETSVIEQDSLVTQIKTQLMKIHFQQAFQGNNNIHQSKRNHNYQQDFNTVRENNHQNQAQDLKQFRDSQLLQQISGTYFFEPQFEDLSFEIDTYNQIKMPKNLEKPINEVKIMLLPDDCEIYQEELDPLTGKLKFIVNKKIVTILSPKVKKNIYLKPEHQILCNQVLQFKDPLIDKIKQDFNGNIEENNEDKVIQREIETTMKCLQNSSISNSLSFKGSISLTNSQNQSLVTFISDDVSLGSNLIQQAMIRSDSQLQQGILQYAANKLNVRENEQLFLLPRLKDCDYQQLKLALLKREPEWWFGNQLLNQGQKKNELLEPILETFMF